MKTVPLSRWFVVLVAIVLGAGISSACSAEQQQSRKAAASATAAAPASATAVPESATASPVPATSTPVPTSTPPARSPSPSSTRTPTPTPTPPPPPTPQPVVGPTFFVNSLSVGCHQSADATAAVVAQLPPGTVLAMDQLFRQPDGAWHREVGRQCWTRTEPGPVRRFGTLSEAETYARSFRPVVLQGVGQTATQPIVPPSSVSFVTFTHNGRSNFIVEAFQDGKEDLLVNTIGQYQGQRPLLGDRPVVFDIRADGAWTLRIEPVPFTTTATFSGKGDAVSGLFDPPTSGAWEIRHDGRRNFIVWLHCAGGSNLVQNVIGTVGGSRVVSFKRGPCMWEVEADGAWSLTPRP